MEDGAAGDDHFQLGTGSEEFGKDGGRADHLLKIIQEQEQVLLAQVVLQASQ